MKTVIEKGNLIRDRALIIETVRRYLTPRSNDRRFDWLYCENPFGEAQVWIARDEEIGTLQGVASAFPRRLYRDGREALGWVLGDFCISDQYRSLGPAVQLQREILKQTENGLGPIWYDFPSSGMTAVYRRLGVTSTVPLVRFAKILTAERVVRRFVRYPTVAKWVAGIADPVLGCWLRRRRGDASVTVHRSREVCGEEFSKLAALVSSGYGTCIIRSADYLNWRYLNCPVSSYTAFVARRNGKLIAYAWVTWDAENAILVDLFGLDDTPGIESLLSEVVGAMLDEHVACLHVPIVVNNHWAPLLRRFGFAARESSAFVSSTGGGTVQGGAGTSTWFLMHGDRDS